MGHESSGKSCRNLAPSSLRQTATNTQSWFSQASHGQSCKQRGTVSCTGTVAVPNSLRHYTTVEYVGYIDTLATCNERHREKHHRRIGVSPMAAQLQSFLFPGIAGDGVIWRPPVSFFRQVEKGREETRGERRGDEKQCELWRSIIDNRSSVSCNGGLVGQAIAVVNASI